MMNLHSKDSKVLYADLTVTLHTEYDPDNLNLLCVYASIPGDTVRGTKIGLATLINSEDFEEQFGVIAAAIVRRAIKSKLLWSKQKHQLEVNENAERTES